MVLNGANEHEELTLMPVDDFNAAYEQESDLLPAFIFADDDDIEDEDDFDDEDGYEDEDDDFEEEDEEDWEDDYE